MSNHIGEMQRVVVCAANRFLGANRFGTNSVIVLGARHFDACMHEQIKILGFAGFNLISGDWEQGFIDQFGVFMDRKEALFVASTAGQINVRRTKTCPLDELYSEDIY